MTFQAICTCGYTSQDFQFIISADVVAEHHLYQLRSVRNDTRISQLAKGLHECMAVEIHEDLEYIGPVPELSSAY